MMLFFPPFEDPDSSGMYKERIKGGTVSARMHATVRTETLVVDYDA